LAGARGTGYKDGVVWCFVAALSLAGAAGLVWLALEIVRFYAEGDDGCDEVDRFDVDGWNVALSRYRPKVDRGRRHAVLLCPGIAANRHVFLAGRERSLVSYLTGLGYDVWILETRGKGRSGRIGVGCPFYDWTFDDLIENEIPRAIARVAEATGAPVHFLGHSMGGVLLYTHVAAHGTANLRSGIVACSSLDYSASSTWFRYGLRFAFLTRVLPAIPMDVVSSLPSLLGLPLSPTDEFNAWRANVEPRVFRRQMLVGVHAESGPLVEQLTSCLARGGLRSVDDRPYLPALAAVDLPFLVLAASRDRQCPIEAAELTFDALRHPDKRMVRFGREHGQAEEYGHMDVFIGPRACTEVFPVIGKWLAAHEEAKLREPVPRAREHAPPPPP
jgi:alpha-beta hydrolase superfamily lysophospholipase